jgi:glutathione synthase/RimK-type ligase-like ATP-grasp enzyme/ribosomal protein S18 acetylase RimI-like enzyme
MHTSFRVANLEDLSSIQKLETQCFALHRQSNRRSLRLSITSKGQEVILLEEVTSNGNRIIGSAAVWFHKKTLRLFSIAINPDFRGTGMGQKLMQYIIDFAKNNSYTQISLEADSNNANLLKWYEKFGFLRTELLHDYYAEGENAWRMHKSLIESSSGKMGENIIVLDSKKSVSLKIENAEIISAREYLGNERFQIDSHHRVFNLCNSYKHQKLGYYVSLMASARDHKIVPNVTTIRDFSSISIIQGLAEEIRIPLQESLKTVNSNEYKLDVLFGQSLVPEMKKLAKLLHQYFEAILFRVTLKKGDMWKIEKMELLNLKKVLELYPNDKIEALANRFFSQKRLKHQRLKSYHYDLAILTNPTEKTPPSCPVALQNFKSAAEDCGFFVEEIHAKDIKRISEFDALFIRETTSVHHHTYNIARRAYAEGLIVIDDPWSILRCSNKIYLYERLRRARIQQPTATLFQKGKVGKELLEKLQYPVVLKVPDGSFSLGVTKVESQTELLEALNSLFKQSEVIIGQEFLQSDFDWRIGLIDRKPVFACKYYMARGHWQIYNWNEQSNDDFSGDSETISLDKVPPYILQTAMKASSLIGDGLYGVDLKEINGKAYVIEVNDNPNIDSGIEDLVAGKELYRTIMTSFYNRIERERHIPRYVSYRKG